MNVSEYENNILEIKRQIDSLRPFDRYILQSLKKWFNVAFSYASNSIEWNTFTEDEVRLLIEDGITVGWKTLKELKEIENHAKIVDKIWDFVNDRFELTEDFIKKLHYDLFKWIIEEKYLWNYRKTQVFISGDELDALASYKDVPKLMKDYVDMGNYKYENKLKHIARIHYDFVKIHPFVDGNWRIARLLMNIYLLKYWFLPIVFPPVVRNEYIWSLKSTRTFDDFYKFFLWQLYENLKDYKRFLLR